MRVLLYFMVVGIGFVISAACGSGTAEKTGTNATSNSAVNENSMAKVVPADTNSIPGISGNTSVANQGSNTETDGKQDIQSTSPNTKGMKPMSRPAPDDSEFSMTLSDVAVEKREFKKHPQLLKLEKTVTPKLQTIKVFLKDGRVIDLPGDAIKSVPTDSAATILRAAGVEPIAPPKHPVQPGPSVVNPQKLPGKN